ncbi:N-formylglutamate deformylase [Sphingomonas koreensis]|uniref:N-formylglutamate deformylase n=1 Tax=Sphingomonas koreensis TaxID=93064 RepID=A0A430G4Q7_9SPHN|nr:N-formylglutamate deformylase [Sphingomonas koreensis]RSY86949.1 N-formylglutamate deformylase [Sphingomonas koreensis]
MIHVEQGSAPLIVSIPHAGTVIPADIQGLVSPELARYDADLYVDHLYAFARGLDATIVRTTVSRTVIDVNRDPSGQTLYPGQFTTGLCPIQTFDGTPLYEPGALPDAHEIERRRAEWFDPYHTALAIQIERLRAIHPAIVVYDAHSIRSVVPKLFDGELPNFNIGTNDGTSCAPALTQAVEAICDASPYSRVTNGRFKGGWITRHYARPDAGVHTIQMELAMRTYLVETPDHWPPPWHEETAQACRQILRPILSAAIDFAKAPK